MANVDLRKIISARDQLESIIVKEAAEEIVRVLDPEWQKKVRTMGNSPSIFFRQVYKYRQVAERAIVQYMQFKAGYDFKEEDVLGALNYLMSKGKVKKESITVGSAHNEHDVTVYSLKSQ